MVQTPLLLTDSLINHTGGAALSEGIYTYTTLHTCAAELIPLSYITHITKSLMHLYGVIHFMEFTMVYPILSDFIQ